MDLGVILLYQPIYNLLIIFYRLLGGNLGIAIIAIAFLFRLITFPITLRQTRMLKDNQELSKRVDEIKKKHKNNKDKQTEEMMKVQSEYLPGQLSGCFSMILQLVVLINVFNVVRNLLSQGTASFNEVAYSFVNPFTTDTINTGFFGIELTQSASGIGYDDIGAVLPYVLLAMLVGVVQFGSARVLMGLRTAKTEEEKEEEEKKKEKDLESNKQPSFGDVLKQSTKQTTYLMPLFITFMSLSFPAGLSLYWTAQSSFVIIQQLILGRVKTNEKD